MKLIHLSDLHLGKRVHGFSLLEDQAYILEQILSVVREEKPDAVLISGDLYDRPVPGADAVSLCSLFLQSLAALNQPVLIISGNHDSSERLSFLSGTLQKGGIYFSPVFDGEVHPVTLQDEYGEVDFWLLPHLRAAQAKRFYEASFEDDNAAIRHIISSFPLSEDRRNVLMAHQFVLGALRCESEEVSVGGLDGVDARLFSSFDYVALGHLHVPQNAGSARVRYCGSPLKYSFSESAHDKSVTVAELKEKGNLEVRFIPLVPRREMRILRGTYDEVTLKSNYENLNLDDYYHIILTDEYDQPHAFSRLRVIYPNLMHLEYDNQRTRENARLAEALPSSPLSHSPLDLLDALYQAGNGQPMDENQRTLAAKLIEEIWSETP